MPSRPATLIIAASETDSNLYYACRFLVPDPIIYFEIAGRKHLVLSDLEIDRARLEAKVHSIHSLTKLSKKLTQPQRGVTHPGFTLIVHSLFKKAGIKTIIVPANFPSSYYESLTKLGYKIMVKADPFFENRMVKNPEEKKHIVHSLRCVEQALELAVTLLKKSKIKGNKIYYGKEIVTSESLRSLINTRLMELGCAAQSTIVSSGVQGSLPHHEGHGPIRPHTPIIFDIFPRNSHSRYWGDMTRTMVKGKPTDTVQKMYQAVYDANHTAMSMVKEGVNVKEVHQASVDTLKKHGFKTGKMGGRMQGFIHSTGHGLGLDIHEPPSVAIKSFILKAGNVITIEPGLYYQKHGGIRLEDVVVVTKDGFEQLTKFPKFLEID